MPKYSEVKYMEESDFIIPISIKDCPSTSQWIIIYQYRQNGKIVTDIRGFNDFYTAKMHLRKNKKLNGDLFLNAHYKEEDSDSDSDSEVENDPYEVIRINGKEYYLHPETNKVFSTESHPNENTKPIGELNEDGDDIVFYTA